MNITQFYSPQNMKEQHLWCSSLRATQATILAVATLTAFALLAAVFPLLSPSEQMSHDLQLCIFISPVLISLLCAVHSYSGAMLTMLRQSALNLSGDDKFVVSLSTRAMIRASVYSFFCHDPYRIFSDHVRAKCRVEIRCFALYDFTVQRIDCVFQCRHFLFFTETKN